MIFKRIIAGITVATALVLGGVALAGPALAATTGAAQPAKVGQAAKGHAKQLKIAVVRISAKTIGIAPKDLLTDIHGGHSIADVATAHGVNPQTVVSALVNAGDARIDKALAAHKISADKANQLKTKLPGAAAKVVNAHRKSFAKAAA